MNEHFNNNKKKRQALEIHISSEMMSFHKVIYFLSTSFQASLELLSLDDDDEIKLFRL